MVDVGSASTGLVVLRGNSGSGKSLEADHAGTTRFFRRARLSGLRGTRTSAVVARRRRPLRMWRAHDGPEHDLHAVVDLIETTMGW